MTEAALCTDESSNTVWVNGTRRTEGETRRMDRNRSRVWRRIQDKDEAAIAEKSLDAVFEEVVGRWYCR